MKILVALIVSLMPAVASAYLLSGTGYAPSCPNFLAPSIITFDSGPIGQFNSAVFGNVKFSGLDGPLDVTPNYITQYNTTGVNSLQSGQVTNPILPGKIEFVFAIPVGAAAFNWGAADNAWLMEAFDPANNLLESHIITLPYSGTNAGEYFGVLNTNIARILLTDQKDNYPLGDHVFIDDFTSSVDTVPEPTLSLLVLVPLICRARQRAPKLSS
jgi:hypothetical protein